MQKFICAHAQYYDVALRELKGGKKESHWMWFIFPQFIGLGESPMSIKYAINSKKELDAYVDTQILFEHFEELCNTLLNLDINDPIQIFGEIDSMKLQSSMTLFSLNDKTYDLALKVLEKFFRGEFDPLTLAYFH